MTMVEMVYKYMPRVCFLDMGFCWVDECFDKENNHLGCLTKLKQSGTMDDFIDTFEHLDFRIEGMIDAFF